MRHTGSWWWDLGITFERRRSDLSVFVTCPECDASFDAGAELAGFDTAEDLRRAVEARAERLSDEVGARLARHLEETHGWPS